MKVHAFGRRSGIRQRERSRCLVFCFHLFPASLLAACSASCFRAYTVHTLQRHDSTTGKRTRGLPTPCTHSLLYCSVISHHNSTALPTRLHALLIPLARLLNPHFFQVGSALAGENARWSSNYVMFRGVSTREREGEASIVYRQCPLLSIGGASMLFVRGSS